MIIVLLLNYRLTLFLRMSYYVELSFLIMNEKLNISYLGIDRGSLGILIDTSLVSIKVVYPKLNC